MGNKGEETKWRGLEFFFLPKLWEGNVDIFRMTKGGSSWFGDLNICSAERQNGFIVVWGVVVFFFWGVPCAACGASTVDSWIFGEARWAWFLSVTRFFFVSSLIWRFARVRAKNLDCVVNRVLLLLLLLLLVVVVVELAVVFPDAERMNARCRGENEEDEGDTPHRRVRGRLPDRYHRRGRCRCRCRRRYRAVLLDVPRARASGFFFGFTNDEKEFARAYVGKMEMFRRRYSFLIRTF